MATKKTSKFKVGDEVTILATVTIADGEKAGADCVVVLLDGHTVPVCLHVDKVRKTGRSERSGRYFLESAD